MNLFTKLMALLSRWAMYIACICLVGLLGVVVYGVVMRYVFNDSPAYVEQVALLLVISVSMFGASAGVRDAGHIGLDSLVNMLPEKGQFWCRFGVYLLSIAFAVTLFFGASEMAVHTSNDTIPTLGISESFRYLPVILAGVLITLFSLEHMIAQFTGQEVIPSWH
ncbi:MAG: TRAP transporter small permease [Proteobacteria bacterium]|nr:TRAP transporter small permease [Pseudomonadota bacterium]